MKLSRSLSVLVAAIAINDRGQIAATARPDKGDGRQRAVLLTPQLELR